MTYRQSRKLRSTLSLWAVSGTMMTALQGDRRPSTVLGNAIICLMIVLLLGAIYRRVLPRLRNVPLLVAVPIAGLAFFIALLLAVAFWIWLITAVLNHTFYGPRTGEALLQIVGDPKKRRGLLYGYLLILSITFGVELTRRLGSERLSSLLLGRYRNPKEERRVFLLIDLRDSTPLAERLGSVKFSALLRDLFRDITEPIVNTGGEVVAYVGDEAIVSWSERRGIEGANALRCFMEVQSVVAKKAAQYERLYGVVPRLKGAIHLGPVVITEVGELRTDVAFHGDALNTATRILDECGPLQADLLISGPAADRMPALSGARLEPLGAFPLRGKGEPLALVRVAFET